MNDAERTYWRSIGMLPEEGSDRRPLGEWMASPEGQELYARLKAAAERMEAHIPRSYRRGDPTWGEAHRDELPDIVECMCGEIVRRWSSGEKRNYPQGGAHKCPLHEPQPIASPPPETKQTEGHSFAPATGTRSAKPKVDNTKSEMPTF